LNRKVNNVSAERQRRRRKPEAAESEILSAADNFLREAPFRDMTIDDIMAGTGLSRPSFYEYFRDRYQLVIRLAQPFGPRHTAICEDWLRAQQPKERLPNVLREIAELYASDGHVIRALADAADGDDQVEIAYRRATQKGIEDVAQRIREDAERGLTDLQDLEPIELAAALIHLTQNYFIEKLGRRPKADPRMVADTLTAIWMRVLYGDSR